MGVLEKMTIVKQEKTCESHPSRWDLWTDDNRYICAEYQYGILMIDLADNKEKMLEYKDFIMLMRRPIGDFYDPEMTLEELKEYTKDAFIWKC